MRTLLSLLTMLLVMAPCGAAWYADTSFNYRQKLTIQSSQVDADLTDFPVYLDTNELSSGFYTHAQADCDDVRITKSDETTEIAREIVFCNGSSGEIHFIASGTLSSSSDTDFYIYYGNGTATDYATSATYGAENVWNSDYIAVWHNQEDPSGSAPQILDSTGNNNDQTSVGSMTSGDLVNGQLSGNALDFDGSDDYLTSAGPNPTYNFTVSFWLNTTNTAHGKAFVTKAAPGAGTSGGWVSGFVNSAGQRAANFVTYNGTTASTVITGSTFVNTGAWFMYHGVQEGGTRADLYINASVDGSDTSTSGTSSSTNVVNQASRGNTGVKVAVKLDEVRIINTNLSSTWISTEYNNQSSPSTFYTAGAEEEEGGGAVSNPLFMFGGFF